MTVHRPHDRSTRVRPTNAGKAQNELCPKEHRQYVKGYEDGYREEPIERTEKVTQSYKKGFRQGLTDWKVDDDYRRAKRVPRRSI